MSFLTNLYSRSLKYLSNVPGWRTSRKIVVFESDDWGSIRMTSKEAFDSLLRFGVHVDRSPYCRYDSLESNDDLEQLFDLLVSVKDCSGRHPSFTALTIVANPDFREIRKRDFREYVCETVTETLKRYPRRDRVAKLWQEGMDSGLYRPQFHGREHVNVNRWMTDLQSNVAATRVAFDNHVTGIGPDIAMEVKASYQAAFDFRDSAELALHQKVLREGLALFESIFGYKATYFVPTNGPFHSSLEQTLAESNVCYVNTSKKNMEPLGHGRYRTRYRSLGMKNDLGQIYITRNCAFEPSLHSDGAVEMCLREIESAFLFWKPAVVSTHRLNYAGSLDERNRQRGLDCLKQLLAAILTKWPNVEFMTSTELGDLIRQGR